MIRLGPLDSAFIAIETPTMLMHTTGTLILDPSTSPEPWDFGRLKALFEARLDRMPPFRRKLVTVPMGLARPLWVDDPDFDLDNHLHRIAAPAPGGLGELAEFVAHLAAIGLDRARPLWDMWVVEGLEGGRVALVGRIHHAIMDGVSGADSMAHLFDLTADAPLGTPVPFEPEHSPTDVELIGYGVASRLRRPADLTAGLARGLGSAVRVARAVSSPAGGRRPALPFTGPRTPLNVTQSAHRSVAFTTARLSEIKAIKDAHGTTLNNIVLAAVTLSLRRWLEAQDALPDTPLVCAVPVSLREDAAPGDFGNQISIMFVSLPVQLETPAEIIEAIASESASAKEMHATGGGDLLAEIAGAGSGGTLTSGMVRLFSRFRLPDRLPPMTNVLVSNVPGPPIPLYCAGAHIDAVFPLGPVPDGTGLNITVLSNNDNLDIGALAARDAVPDAWAITDGINEAFRELEKAAPGGGRARRRS